MWEWINPYYSTGGEKKLTNNMIYRGYRYPYNWVPQEEIPVEIPIIPIDVTNYRLPNAGKLGAKKNIEVKGTKGYADSDALCVAKIDESNNLGKKLTNNEKILEINKKLEQLKNK